MPKTREELLRELSATPNVTKIEAQKVEEKPTETLPTPPVEAAPVPDSTTSATSSASLPTSPLDTDEWRFIEKCCAEVDLRDDGNQTNIYKKFYQSVKAKLTVWRITRDLALKMGPGAKWPEWTSLNLNPGTGLPSTEKPMTPVAPAVKPVEKVAPPTVSVGSSQIDEMEAAIRNSVGMQISSRAEPPREGQK